ncbi:patatin-like phospholipase family protein [uncultured Ferrimonas sp.]|uniref:patatin-like phospholipase family protein n=1 Tax=uncultured Ferrimonas sp. TaxID=432640 RepID=UPI00262BA297|nr:patatin-like phospholipase family protein [uncultured Ferrimonas sp.]
MFGALTLLLSALFSGAQAQPRLKVGVALSGGGAKGAAHVGVLRVLEQHQIPVDYIAGTSMGAYVATLYSLGYSVDEIEQRLITLDFSQGFSDTIPRQDLSLREKLHRDQYPVELKIGFEQSKLKFAKGALEGQRMASLLRRSIGAVPSVDHFDQLPIPLRTIATDLSDRSEVIIDSGDFVSAMQASMAVPGALAPVERNGRLLVDGGLANNMPVQVVRDMGADVVIAVDIGSPLKAEDQLNSLFDVLDQLSSYLTILSRDQQVALMQPQDVLVVPNIEGVGTTDFELMGQMIPRGETAMAAQVQQLARYALSASAYQQLLAQRQQAHQQLLVQNQVLTAVKLDNQSWVKDEVILEALELPVGSQPSSDAVDAAVARVYAINDFARVDAALQQGEQGQVLTLTTKGKDWGPNMFDLGLRLEDNFDDSINWEIGLALTSNNVGPLDGQWRNTLNLGSNRRLVSEYYQPLDDLRYSFAIASIEFQQREWDAFSSDGAERLAQLEQEKLALRLGVGVNLGNAAQLQLAYNYEDGAFKPELGSEPFDQRQRYWRRGVEILFGYDQLDTALFPSSGSAWQLQALQIHGSSDDQGSDSEDGSANFWVYRGGWLGANQFGPHGIFAKADLVLASKDITSITHFTTAGGFLDLSGFYRDALYGNHKVLTAAGYYFDLGKQTITGEWPLKVGMSLEAGNVWLNRDDIDRDDLIYAGSVFVGAETDLGNLSFGLGYNDRHQTSLYLTFGHAIHQR